MHLPSGEVPSSAIIMQAVAISLFVPRYRLAAAHYCCAMLCRALSALCHPCHTVLWRLCSFSQ
uniref:Uncharacterized protein n=1 Tax=Picea glauca TaxID=3330 RepID=A0A117NGI7_PICGL|nr:hypothetical protein ABT39_MTgene6323 [Picea glauca]